MKYRKVKLKMVISITLETPNFDIAMLQAIDRFKKVMDEANKPTDLWNHLFTLTRIHVEDNFRRREYTYVFEADSTGNEE